MNKKVLVYIQEKELAPQGGPVAVCYYYYEEQKKRGQNEFSFLHDLRAHESLHDKESKYLSRMPDFFKRLYFDIKAIIKYNRILGLRYSDHFDFSGYDIVHFHDTLSIYTNRHELENYKGTVLLQSHSPKPFSQEMIDNIPVKLRKFIPFLRKRAERIDKYAFERADYIIFPCEYAEEPYFNNWPYYKTIHNVRKEHYKYLLTGIPACEPKRTRQEVCEELSIPQLSFIISYVGRHNEVKGYDNLRMIGKKVLDTGDDIWMVCAGKEEPLTRLNHQRWIEIGWTNDAHSYIAASDVFVLPNKETYFDIVMMEVLSLGKIVVASRTGGNKFFEEKGCSGVFLYDTLDEARDIILRLKNMAPERREELGNANKVFFERFLTVGQMYNNYIKLLHSL